MIRRAWRGVVRSLGSALFATGLLAFLGLWSMAATFIPQGRESDPAVAAWASANPFVEPVVRAIGLHQAFSSVVFALCVLALSLSTAVCAWQRTNGALRRARALGAAASEGVGTLAHNHDFEVVCNPALTGAEVTSIASDTLRQLDIRAQRRGDVLSSVSPAWSVLGSPIFHWSLLALIVVILASSLQRSEGLMGVVVGQTLPDVPGSYGVLHTGPLHDWAGVDRSIRVDAFDLQYRTGGIDRGPAPTVSVLDGSGQVVRTQRVYPNMTLKTGSLTVYPSAYGLSATVSMVNTSGAETGSFDRLVDFSKTAAEGTVPSGFLGISDAAGKLELKAYVTVPLDVVKGQFAEMLPEKPAARVLLTTLDGATVADRIVGPGQAVPLPGGGSLRVDDIGYYARLKIVDDWSTIPLYACMVMATIGLTIAGVTRQQIVLVAAVDGPDGPLLVARVRLWRNASTSRGALESALAEALGESDKGIRTLKSIDGTLKRD